MLKRLVHIALSCFIAVFIEILFFNFSIIENELKGYHAYNFRQDELQYLNWDEQMDGSRISLADPIIYKDGLAIHAKTVTIRADFEELPDAYVVFYTTDPEERFNAEKMIVVETAPNQEVVVPLEKKICALRVDPGEDAGRVLHDISLAINENVAAWNISLPRIVAMLIVYWGAKGLFRLQKAPDYGISQEGMSDEDSEE